MQQLMQTCCMQILRVDRPGESQEAKEGKKRCWFAQPCFWSLSPENLTGPSFPFLFLSLEWIQLHFFPLMFGAGVLSHRSFAFGLTAAKVASMCGGPPTHDSNLPGWARLDVRVEPKGVK